MNTHSAAEKLFKSILDRHFVCVAHKTEESLALIEKALREAQDEAYERAADIIEHGYIFDGNDVVASEIRSLKSGEKKECKHENGTWFDRTVSGPDWSMHNICNDCGQNVD